jgi:hypothetical protein
MGGLFKNRERDYKSKAHRKSRAGASSREVVAIPLIQFIGGWKWYPVLSRGLTIDAQAATAPRLRGSGG